MKKKIWFKLQREGLVCLCCVLVVVCLLFVCYLFVCCLLFVVCCLLFVVCCLLFVVCCLLFVVCCLLFVVCCLLFVGVVVGGRLFVLDWLLVELVSYEERGGRSRRNINLSDKLIKDPT